MMDMKEIKHFDTHEVIQMIMEGVVKGNIESSQAISAVKHLMDIDSKQAENFVAKPTENPLMQEFFGQC